MDSFTVIKRDHSGKQVLAYTGDVIARGDTWVCIRALFQYGDVDLGFVQFRVGDIFTEWFYSGRWYNVFRIEDGVTGDFKGWYCNITRPAEIKAQQVAADDLALDVFVMPSGEVHLLDEDEFEALPLSPADRQSALSAVEAIKLLAEQQIGPFARQT